MLAGANAPPTKWCLPLDCLRGTGSLCAPGDARAAPGRGRGPETLRRVGAWPRGVAAAPVHRPARPRATPPGDGDVRRAPTGDRQDPARVAAADDRQLEA